MGLCVSEISLSWSCKKSERKASELSHVPFSVTKTGAEYFSIRARISVYCTHVIYKACILEEILCNILGSQRVSGHQNCFCKITFYCWIMWCWHKNHSLILLLRREQLHYVVTFNQSYFVLLEKFHMARTIHSFYSCCYVLNLISHFQWQLLLKGKS